MQEQIALLKESGTGNICKCRIILKANFLQNAKYVLAQKNIEFIQKFETAIHFDLTRIIQVN